MKFDFKDIMTLKTVLINYKHFVSMHEPDIYLKNNLNEFEQIINRIKESKNI